MRTIRMGIMVYWILGHSQCQFNGRMVVRGE